jgi:hypothetical protein
LARKVVGGGFGNGGLSGERKRSCKDALMAGAIDEVMDE